MLHLDTLFIKPDILRYEITINLHLTLYKSICLYIYICVYVYSLYVYL